MANALFEKVQNHFATGGVVVIATTHRATEYKPKHSTMFKAPSKVGDEGIYVQRGKSWDYVFPQYVRFGRYV